MTDFTEFKSAFEESNKLTVALRDAVESKADANTVATLETKLAESLDRVSALEAAAARPTATKSTQENEHKSAFIGMLRKSDDAAAKARLAAIEEKQVNISTPANGGYAVPHEMSRTIYTAAADFSAFRSLARVISVSNENFVEPISNDDAGSGWVGELGERTLTATPTLGQFKPTYGEVYAVAEVSNHALHDIFFDVEAWLVGEIARKFANREAEAFYAGDGVNKPTGILTGTTVGTIASGAAGGFGAVPFDALLDLRYSVKGEYAKNGVFLMNSGTLATLAKVKNSNGDYIYNTPVSAGLVGTLLGKPVYTEEMMVGSNVPNAKAVIFGDIARAYTIADLVGMSLIVDNVTRKGFTQFYLSKRVGGGIKDANAVKALQIRA